MSLSFNLGYVCIETSQIPSVWTYCPNMLLLEVLQIGWVLSQGQSNPGFTHKLALKS